MDDHTLLGDTMGDVRCVQCLDGEGGFEPFIMPDLLILGELVEAFGKQLTCKCGRLTFDARAQMVITTPGTATNGT